MPFAHMQLHYGSEKMQGWDYAVLDTIIIDPIEKPAYQQLSPALLLLPRFLLIKMQDANIFCWTKAGISEAVKR